MGNINLMEYWPIILMLALMYFMVIRPQQKRRKEQVDMLGALGEGSEVVTAGGILGKIVSLDNNVVHLEVASNVVILVQKSAVTTLLPSGTMDTTDQLPPPPPSCCA